MLSPLACQSLQPNLKPGAFAAACSCAQHLAHAPDGRGAEISNGPKKAEPDYLIRGCLLPTGGLLGAGGYTPSDVRISRGRIASVVPTAAAAGAAIAGTGAKAADDGTTVIDGKDKLLLPGLHNAHTHSSGFWAKGGIAPLPLELMVATPRVWDAEHPGNTNGEPTREDTIERYRIGQWTTSNITFGRVRCLPCTC